MPIYTVSQKIGHPTLAYNSAKCWPIFKSLLPADSAVKCNEVIIKDLTIPQARRYTTLWNVNVRKTAIIWNNKLSCLWKEFKLNLNGRYDWFLSQWIFKMSSCSSNADMETPRRWSVAWSGQYRITGNAVPLQPTHQSDTASNQSHPALLSGGLVAELCHKFYGQLN